MNNNNNGGDLPTNINEYYILKEKIISKKAEINMAERLKEDIEKRDSSNGNKTYTHEEVSFLRKLNGTKEDEIFYIAMNNNNEIQSDSIGITSNIQNNEKVFFEKNKNDIKEILNNDRNINISVNLSRQYHWIDVKLSKNTSGEIEMYVFDPLYVGGDNITARNECIKKILDKELNLNIDKDIKHNSDIYQGNAVDCGVFSVEHAINGCTSEDDFKNKNFKEGGGEKEAHGRKLRESHKEIILASLKKNKEEKETMVEKLKSLNLFGEELLTERAIFLLIHDEEITSNVNSQKPANVEKMVQNNTDETIVSIDSQKAIAAALEEIHKLNATSKENVKESKDVVKTKEDVEKFLKNYKDAEREDLKYYAENKKWKDKVKSSKASTGKKAI